MTPATPHPRRRLALRLLAGILLFFAIDAALFRSGLYFRWINPQSTLGSVAQAIDNPRHTPAERRTILVMGDSRIGEGFSAPTATAAADRLGHPITFASGSVGGTMPRVWNYLLREMRDPANRFAAIAVMLPSYRDDEAEKQADRRADIAFVHPLLRLADAVDFPASFEDPAARQEALTAILFKGFFYKSDVQDFLRSPGNRARGALAARLHGHEWATAYPGRPESLAGLGVDLATGQLAIPPGHEALKVPTLIPYAERLSRFRGRPPENTDAAAYRRLWLGRLAAQARASGAKLFVFRIPRGPLHHLLADDAQPEGVLADMARAGDLEILPASLLAPLERPEFFFDDLHLNRDGRAQLSTLLAEAVLQRLPAKD